MANKGEQTIIIKKIKKGGHGGHGGSWKVAFADFMTAMMAFFLVMWLMGSDEETKSAVAHYFNNPSAAWRPDLAHPQTVPLGEQTGAGQDVLPGAEGMYPEDLIERPSRELQEEPNTKPNDQPKQFKEGMNTLEEMNIDLLRFTVPADRFFQPGGSELIPGALAQLQKLRPMIREFQGYITVRGHPGPRRDQDLLADPHELALLRAVTIGKQFVQLRWMDQDHVNPTVVSPERDLASARDPDDATQVNPEGFIEFVLTRKK